MPRLRVATPQVTGKIRPVGHPLLEDADDLLVVDLLALEVALHQLVGVLGDLVHQFLAVFLGLGPELLGDLDLGGVAAARPLVDEGLHVDQVDDAADAPVRSPIGISVATTWAPKERFSESRAAKKSARSRSSMLTKTSRARPSASARRQSRSVLDLDPRRPR